MNPQVFLVIVVALSVLYAILFYRSRKYTKAPTKLNLRNSTEPVELKGGKAVKDIAIVFNYNGHSWNAHEVLGTTKSSNLIEIKLAFEKALKQADPKSHEFLKTALEAILMDLKDRGLKP